MTYEIREAFIGGKSAKIDSLSWENLKTSKQTLVSLLAIEELFNLLAESYLDFEKCLFEKHIDHLKRSGAPGDLELFASETKDIVNLRVLNFLTCTKSFLDQTPQHKKKLPQTKEAEFKESTSRSFDRCIEYRIAEALRNLAQHAILPIGYIAYSHKHECASGRSEPRVPSRTKLTIEPAFSAKDFDSNKIKAKTRAEVAGLEVEWICAKSVIRMYVRELNTIHIETLEATRDQLKIAEAHFDKAYGDFPSDSPRFLEIWDKATDEKHFLKQTLPSMVYRRRERWFGLANVASDYYSTEITRPSNNKKKFILSDERIWVP